jgi:hypothetical protein
MIAVPWVDVVSAARAAAFHRVEMFGTVLSSEDSWSKAAWLADPWQRAVLLQALEVPLLRSTALGAERFDAWDAAGRPTPDPALGAHIVFGDVELSRVFVAACRLAHPCVVDHAIRLLQVFAAGGGTSLAWTGPSPKWKPITMTLSGKTRPGKPSLFITAHELGHVWFAPIPSEAEPGIPLAPAEEAAAIDARIAEDPELQAIVDRKEAAADALAHVWSTRP